MPNQPTLFVVGLPIGNTRDLSERAKQVLCEVDLIAAEDTRRTGLLIQKLGLPKKPLMSYHDHSEKQRATQLAEKMLEQGLQVALVSDAGTPCISDPGYRLVDLCRSHQIPVHPVPGPSALTSLVSISGLPSDRLLFIGFLPVKSKLLRQEISSWQGCNASIIFYETPRRLSQVVSLIHEIYPGAHLVIARELTKIHEQSIRLPVDQAKIWVAEHTHLKGEACVMVSLPQVELAQDDIASLRHNWEQQIKQGTPFKTLIKQYSGCGLSRGELYQELLDIKNKTKEIDDGI